MQLSKKQHVRLKLVESRTLLQGETGQGHVWTIELGTKDIPNMALLRDHAHNHVTDHSRTGRAGSILLQPNSVK